MAFQNFKYGVKPQLNFFGHFNIQVSKYNPLITILNKIAPQN